MCGFITKLNNFLVYNYLHVLGAPEIFGHLPKALVLNEDVPLISSYMY